MTSFGARLVAATAARGRLCVGIDPHPGLLSQWGLSLDHHGLERFALSTVDALGATVAVFKPQSAFFEAYGSRGVAVLERVIALVGSAGALTLLDIKRGDIGSTMAAYAAAYLTDGSPLAADAVTLSPYLGLGALRPAIDAAAGSGRGVFVLARTSNVDGADLQGAVHNGRTVAQSIVDGVAAENVGARPLGSMGLVVGATGPHGLELDQLNGPVLAPGLGAQGATAADLGAVFGHTTAFVLPSTSRGVLGCGPDPDCLRAAVARAIADVSQANHTDPVS